MEDFLVVANSLKGDCLSFSTFLFIITHLLVESALRELFRAKHGSFPPNLSSGELSRSARLTQNEDGEFGDSSLRESEMFKDTANEERDKFPSERSSLVDLDEFFDVPEPSDNDNLDESWTSDFDLDTCCQVATSDMKKLQESRQPKLNSSSDFCVCQLQESRQPKLNSATNLVKKLHDLAGDPKFRR